MPKDIVITRNIALNDTATNNATSQVGEPSVATNGSKIFVTGNWYASRSTNNGSSFSYVNPYSTTPSAAGGFCCDQLTLYDAKRKIWIWILQYLKTSAGTNVFRIAISRDANFATGNWYWWDMSPSQINSGWSNVWYDYPDAALSDKYLFVSFNLFNNADQWQRAVMMRFPLDTLANGGSLGYQQWNTNQNGSLRLTQQANPSSKMYFASHSGNSQIRVFSWPDNSNSVSSWNVGVNAWSNNSSSIAPNGVNWLSRADGRITAGALGNGKMTFMWTAGAGTNRPHAFCRAVRIRESDKSVINQPDLWSNNGAWAYPACCYNTGGTLGFTAFFGGGGRNPGHIVGVYDSGSNSWANRYSRLGSHSPNAGRWGDYYNCRADLPLNGGWVASGFTQEGGEAGTNIVPRVVRYNYVDTMPVRRVINNFGYTAGGWRLNRHPRIMGDTTNDGKADVIGFGNKGVYVSRALSNGNFAAPKRVVSNFGYSAGGWRVERHPRVVADTLGKGRCDIVGFGNAGVYVSRADAGGNFSAPALVVSNFGYNAGGWRVERHPRFMADITGDGRADVIGFGNAGVYVSRAGGGGSYGAVTRVVDNFGYTAGGWRVDRHPRMMVDTTGDGRADIVGFGNKGVYIATARTDGTFNPIKRVVDNFGYSAGGWRVDRHPRMMADITGDKRADIIGFGNTGVFVSLANANGTYKKPKRVLNNFGYNAGGWRTNLHPRMMADTTGDGRADIVGFGNAGVYVATSRGDGTFNNPVRVVDNFGVNAGGWDLNKHPRMMADITGEGKADIIGFGNAGVYVSLFD